MSSFILAFVLVIGGSAFFLWRSFRASGACVRKRPTEALPSVSVLKPIKGLDDALHTCLQSILDQQYAGHYEVILGIADADDPALPVVRDVMRSDLTGRFRLVVGDSRPALNPKVGNLVSIASFARHDYLFVLDANVWVQPTFLANVMSEDLADLGVLSCPIVGSGEYTLGATLENLHLNTFVAAGVALLHRIGHPCVIGKAMLVPRTALAEIGGFQALTEVLAEDYVTGVRMRKLGKAIRLAKTPVYNINRTTTVSMFLARHLRWAQMRRNMELGAYVLEPAFNTAVQAAVAFAVSGVMLAVGWVGFRLLVDLLFASRFRGAPLSLTVAPLLLVKDVLLLGVWLYAWFDNRVSWRGTRMRVSRGTLLSTLPEYANASIRRDFGRA